MLSHTSADFAIPPDTLADAMLHALPDQWLRVDVQLPHILDVEDAAMFLQMSVDGRLFSFQETRFHGIFLVGCTALAEKLSRAPFDDVGVEEHGLVVLLVRGIGLEHAYPFDGAVDKEGFQFVRDHVVVLAERLQGYGEGVLVAPAGPALSYEGIIVLRPVIVVVRCQAERLDIISKFRSPSVSLGSCLPMPFLVPYYLTRFYRLLRS